MSGQDDFFLRHTAQDRLIDYWWDVDANDARRAADFYTADCVYQMLEHRMDGPAEVDAYYAYRRGRGARLVRHVLTNLQSRVVTAREVSVKGVLTVYATDGAPVQPSAPPILVADNEATLVQEDDGVWRMRLHSITALFRGGVPVLVPPRP